MTLLPVIRTRDDAATPPDGEILSDLVAARLQERLEILATQPADAAPRSRIPSAATDNHHSGGLAAEVDDLNQQLELLREQLEGAFDEVDGRIAAADTRAATAVVLAEAADSRAQVASARAANVLYAVDDLAAELTEIAQSSEPDIGRLLSAVDRLKTRLQPS
jgi:hypothetical protein